MYFITAVFGFMNGGAGYGNAVFGFGIHLSYDVKNYFIC